MADPITLIGLASSIISFVEFGVDLVSTIRVLYDSHHGTLPEIHDIRSKVLDVQRANRQAMMEVSQYGNPKETFHLSVLAQECEDRALELEDLLNELKMRDEPWSRTLESGRVAVRTWWKKKSIDDLLHRLLVLSSNVKERTRDVLQRELTKKIRDDLKRFQDLQQELGTRSDSQFDTIQNEIQNVVQAQQEMQAEQLVLLMQKLRTCEDERRIFQHQLEVLRSLRYEVLYRRWYSIAEVEPSTNSWLFDRSQTTFIEWLEDYDGIYWISGKAGSGKSTLMKFASEHEETLAALTRWSHDRPWFTASFYFWRQGFDMQKSQVGLLRSLLFQIVNKTPSLALKICPENTIPAVWDLVRLRQAYRCISQETDLSAKFCFFIDGLDEYDGDENEVAKMLLFLCQSRHVKLCVSSRPRASIETVLWKDAPGCGNGQFTFAIHDFTIEDMRKYVEARLTEGGSGTNQGYRSISDEIITQISEQAQGVWLWVSLVARDLQGALRRNESVATLRRLMQELPPDLESYFSLMISRVDKRFRTEMARIFLIVIEEVQPLPLFAFSLLEEEDSHPDYALDVGIGPLTNRSQRTQGLWERIQVRCSDLLVLDHREHPIFLHNSVDFLHRTVRDYLQDCYYDNLKVYAKDFDPLVSLCRISLYLLKRLPTPDFNDKRSIHKVMGLVDECLYYAHEAEQRHSSQQADSLKILDEVDRVNTIYTQGMTNHWTQARDSPATRGYDEYREGGNCNFLALAIQARLVEYVSEKLDSQPDVLTKKRGRPLLDYALRPLRVTTITMPYHSQRDEPSVNVQMIELLLQKGANPNAKVYLNRDRTVWALFLLACYQAEQEGPVSDSLRNAWCEACKILIKSGARLDQSLGKDIEGLSVQGILRNQIFKGQDGLLTNIIERSQLEQSSKSLSTIFKNVLGRLVW
ncbi:hypothetical protein AbraIFM66950_003577 [Aspergillus brasiliensis]|nr:hypothetical protein AbraIFM66950_003577 [Aspergillus brasiliensis]